MGDEVLKEISNILMTNIREHDTIVRWGGEEFLILLPETDLKGASIVAEKIRIAISEQSLTELDLKITASFGVSTLNDKDTEVTLINRTDEALYEAKETGRNKVVMK